MSLLLGLANLAIAGTGGWIVTATPIALVQGIQTNVVVTATNINGSGSVGCVRLQIPSSFTVGTVAVELVTPARSWIADPPATGSGGSTIVWVHAITEGDVFKNDGESVVFHVRVKGTSGGVYTWPAESRDHADCTSGIDTGSLTITVAGVPATPAPTPTPKPTPTPTPTSTPTRKPTPTPTPKPTASPTSPAPRSTPVTATATPEGEVATPSPTPTPVATSANSPLPTPSVSPRETSQPVAGPVALGSPAPPSTGGTSTSDHLVVGGQPGTDGIDGALMASNLAGLDGIEWAVPTLVLTVPGLLVVLAVMTQIAAGAAWLPIVRRKIGSIGRGNVGATARAPDIAQ
jgi:outer membrane biosynthesis protein TonB